MRRFGVLDWHQEKTERPRTFLEPPDAERFVTRLAAEKISKHLIRMFDPASVFYALRPIPPSLNLRSIPGKLPPAEIENCRFVPPLTAIVPTSAGIRAGWDWSAEA